MKKLIISFMMFLLSSAVFAQSNYDDSEESCDCNPPYASAMGSSFGQINSLMGMVNAAVTPPLSDKAFQRRPIPNLRRLMTIESDFKIPPVVANDTFFAHLYMAGGVIKYRDQMIAQRRRREERRTGSNFNSSYNVSDINSARGMELVNDHGAFVGVKNAGSRPFNLTSGGRVDFTFKSPGSSFRASAKINISITRGVPTSSLVTPTGNVVFDTLKLRSGALGIAGGIKRLEFMRDGRVAYTLTMP